MKRLLLILVFILIFTGCEGSYDLYIYGDDFKEMLTTENKGEATFDIIDEKGYSIRNAYEKEMMTETKAFIDAEEAGDLTSRIDGVEYYTKNYIPSDSSLKINMEYTFKKANISKSTIIKYFFPEFTITEKYGTTILDSGRVCNVFYYYPQLSKININIITDYKVISSNTSEKLGNVYTWTITKGEVKSREINPLKLNYKESETTGFESSFGFLILLLLILAIIVFLAIIFARARQEKQGQI